MGMNNPQTPARVNDAVPDQQQRQAAHQQEIDALNALQAQQAIPPVPPAETQAPQTIDALPPEQALTVFVQNPVGFIRDIVEQAASMHLTNLKEEAELRGALNAIRKSHPQYAQFEEFILQETGKVIQEDPETAIKPWHDLLEAGLERFKKNFKELIKAEAGKATSEAGSIPNAPVPYMEGASVRELPTEVPSFTREQIAKMSLDEFLAKEPAINQALQNNRIK